jgi:hypothetical protein
MGYAKRSLPIDARRPALDRDMVMDDTTAARILEQTLVGGGTGNPIAGLRNAAIGSVVFWLLIAIAVAIF